MTDITEKIAELLQKVFTYVFYPAFIVILFLGIWFYVIVIIRNGNDFSSVFRRSIGAIIPLIILVFSFTVSESSESLAQYFVGLPVAIQWLLGAGLGVMILEIGKFVSRNDSDAGAATYTLFASSIGTFLLYCFTQGTLEELNNFLLGFIIAGGLDIIFRGIDTY